MAGRIEGKVALISGGARGMGAAEAKLFVAEGGRVVIGDVLDEEGAKTASALGEAGVFTHLDVGDEQSWQAAVALARERFGSLDVLVNNAGILRFGPLEHTPLDEYEAVLRVNQTGCFLGMKSVIGAMRDAGGGSIVNISSVAGLQGVAFAIAYTATKHAVCGMTKVAALELGGDGIRVNSIHPGGVDTPMVRRPGDTREEGIDVEGQMFKQPIPRIGRPEEIAELALWLASSASSYCTGAEFVIDGGMMAGSVIPLPSH